MGGTRRFGLLLAVREGGLNLLLGHVSKTLVQLGQLTAQVVVPSQRCQERRLRDAVTAAWQLEMSTFPASIQRLIVRSLTLSRSAACLTVKS